MSDRPLDRADDVRAFLERMATEAPREPAPEGVVRRARRRVAVTIVGGVLAAALLAAGATGALERIQDWNRTLPGVDRSTPPATPTSVASPTVEIRGRFGQDDLEGLTLRPAERPPGYGLRHEDSEWDSAAGVASTLRVPLDELERAGLVTAFLSGYLSEGWTDLVLISERGVDLLCYAILFPDARSAHAGFALLSAGPQDDDVDRWRRREEGGLGDEAATGRGVMDRLETTALIWRVDNVVLFLASQGSENAIPLSTLRALAEPMDARAR
jgi:hypothetical protein